MEKLKLNSLELLDINLQLFAGDEDNDSGNQEDVVDLQDEEDEAELEESEDESQDDEAEKLDVADPDKSKQSHEDNEQFKKMRQKAKSEVLKELEEEKAKLDADKKAIEEFKQQQNIAKIEQKYLSEVTQQAVEDLAYQEGISEEFAKKHLFELAKNNAAKEIHGMQARMNQYQFEKESLKNKPYFKELEKDIDVMISQNPQINVSTAYNYLRGVKLDELIANTKSSTVKSTLANVQDNAKRRSIPSGNADNGLDVGKVLTKQDMEMTNAFGNDPRKIAKYVKTNLKK